MDQLNIKSTFYTHIFFLIHIVAFVTGKCLIWILSLHRLTQVFDTFVVVTVVLALESCITDRTKDKIIFMNYLMFVQTELRFEFGTTHKTNFVSFGPMSDHVTFLK